jgi:hypothetical protein
VRTAENTSPPPLPADTKPLLTPDARLGGDGWGNDAQNGRGLRIRRGARKEVLGWRKAAANERRDAYLGRAVHLVAEYGPSGANRLTLRWSCSSGWCSAGASNKAKAASGRQRAAQQVEVGSEGAAVEARARQAERQSAGIGRFVELFSPSRGFGGTQRFASAPGVGIMGGDPNLSPIGRSRSRAGRIDSSRTNGRRGPVSRPRNKPSFHLLRIKDEKAIGVKTKPILS